MTFETVEFFIVWLDSERDCKFKNKFIAIDYELKRDLIDIEYYVEGEPFNRNMGCSIEYVLKKVRLQKIKEIL